MNAEAEAMVGRYVRLAHLPANFHATPILVVASTTKGMICLEGHAGEFAPHLFVVIEGPES